MPIIKSAKKAARQAVKRTAANVEIKKSIRSALKSFKAKPSVATASKIQSEYDKAVKKGLLKKNTASRRKAAIARVAKSAGVKITATASKKSTDASVAPKKKSVSVAKPKSTEKKKA